MHPAISQYREDISNLCRRFGVTRLEAFGSAARGTDFDTVKSDADFLVEFRKDNSQDPLAQFFGLAFALEETLGRRVDLVEVGALENPFILATIEADRETIYES